MEPNNDGVILSVKDRRVIFEVRTSDLKDTEPTRELCHITDKLVATLDARYDRLVTSTEAADIPWRLRKGLVGLR